MKPRLESKNAFRVIGIAARTSNAEEMNSDTAKIPELWGRMFEKNLVSQIPSNSSDEPMIGAYTEYESDHTGPYTLIVGQACDFDRAAPQEMTAFDFPQQDYLVFAGSGPIPMCVIETWQQIWQYFERPSDYERSFVADFEEYNAKGSSVNIYIGVEKP